MTQKKDEQMRPRQDITAEISRAVESLLTAAAVDEAPCPSNDAMGRESTKIVGEYVRPRQIEYAIRRLRDGGKIEMANTGGGYRQVYVKEVDKWTAISKNERHYPPHRKQAARDVSGNKRPQLKRRCLSCGRDFESRHPVASHRICGECTQTDVYRGGGDLGGLYA